MAANLTAALQNVTQQIDNLGAGKIAGKPSPALSRVTDTVVGTSVHDFHKLRPAGVPVAIPENALLDSASKASAETKASKTKYIIGIVIVVALIIAVMVALYFLRKRTEERERQEKEEATKRVTLHEEDADDNNDDDDDEKIAFPVRMMSPPLSMPQRAAPVPMPMPMPVPVPITPAQPPAAEMEAAVAKALETKKRLEALKQNLDKGISNVVTNVSETVAQTIVAEKTFQAHTATQEHDEKVLLNQGTPSLAAAPLDKDVSVIADAAVLDEPTDAHPTNDTPAGGAVVPDAESTA